MSIQKKILYTILIILIVATIQAFLKDLKFNPLISVIPVIIGGYYIQTRIWSKKK
jgi:hypothetical protein